MKRKLKRAEWMLILAPLAVFTVVALRLQIRELRYEFSPRSFDAGGDKCVKFVFSADGSKLATKASIQPVSKSAPTRMFVRIWDVDSCQLLWQLPDPVNCEIMPSFSPDGTQLITTRSSKDVVTGSPSADIQILDASNGKLIRSITAPDIHFASFVNKGKNIIGGGNGTFKFTVEFWDSRTGRLQRSLQGGYATEFSRDATLMINLKPFVLSKYVEGYRAQLISTSTGRTILEFPKKLWMLKGKGNHPPDEFAISPDKRFLASAGLSSSTQLWDIKTGTLISELPSKDAPHVLFSTDSTRLVALDWHFGATKNNIRQKPYSTVKVFQAPSGHLLWQQDWNQLTFKASFSRDGRLLAVEGNKFLRLFDSENGKVIQDFPYEGSGAHQFTRDSRNFAIAEGQYVRIYPINH